MNPAETIQRYDIGNAGNMVPHPDGDWLSRADCERILAAALAEAERVRMERDKYMEYAGKCADACETLMEERDEAKALAEMERESRARMTRSRDEALAKLAQVTVVDEGKQG